MLVNTCSARTWVRGTKRLGCHAAHKEVSRCCTRAESEKSIACRRQTVQVRDPSWTWNPGQRSPEVYNRNISGCTKTENRGRITHEWFRALDPKFSHKDPQIAAFKGLPVKESIWPLWGTGWAWFIQIWSDRSGLVNSKSFVGMIFLQIRLDFQIKKFPLIQSIK